MKILVLLVVISACRSGVIPSSFNADGSIPHTNVKVKNARLKWIEWKKLNLSSRSNVMTEDIQGMKNDHISSSTENMKPTLDAVIDDNDRFEDNVGKFRKLNEQGIFGAQFLEKDTTAETARHDHLESLHDSHLSSKLSNTTKIKNETSLNGIFKDDLDSTGAEENTWKNITHTLKDSNKFIENVTTPEGPGIKDTNKILHVLEDSHTKGFQALEDEVFKLQNISLTNSDKFVDITPLKNEKNGVTGSNAGVIKSPETEIIKVVYSDETTEDVNDRIDNVEITDVNASVRNITEDIKLWKNSDLLKDANRADISKSTSEDEFAKLLTEAKNSEKMSNDSDSLNSVTESESTLIKQDADLINLHPNDETTVAMQTNAPVFTEPESRDNKQLDKTKSNYSLMQTEIGEFSEPSELILSELIENVKNISGILDSLHLMEPIGFEVVTDNISYINVQSVDETQVLNGGSEITLFPDQQATGSEFLLDSETAKNIIIREMLSTPEFLGDINFINNLSSDSSEEIPETGSELLSTVIANLSDPLQDILNEPENASVILNSSVEVLATELKSSTEVFTTESVTENTAGSADTSPPKKCPPHGICIFWFLGRDGCVRHDECGKSEMCCKVRCSTICIKV